MRIRATGKHAVLSVSDTERGYDVLAAGQRFSLKTEGAKDIKPDQIIISKLMECAWLRHCERSTEILLAKIHEYVLPHFQEYDRVLTLRIFRLPQECAINYVLIEIPKSLLTAMGTLTESVG